MLGLMQHAPLLISSLIEHAAAYHPEAEIVVRTVEGPLLRTNYATVRRRAKRLANALKTLDIAQSDRVGTLAWLQATGADPARLNVNGGAIALGHPLGASGTKLVTTLVHALKQRNKRYGLQTMCEGGGMANVTIIERL